ncbi:hypothetical protein J6590_030535 [Homalodisca vitripennis]|nr:hypothetical protein J6590_030535 [Homalodisca vitripennis]
MVRGRGDQRGFQDGLDIFTLTDSPRSLKNIHLRELEQELERVRWNRKIVRSDVYTRHTRVLRGELTRVGKLHGTTIQHHCQTSHMGGGGLNFNRNSLYCTKGFGNAAKDLREASLREAAEELIRLEENYSDHDITELFDDTILGE